MCQVAVAAAFDPTQSQDHRLDLVGVKHQWWQVESVIEDVTDAGLAAHRHPIPLQRGNIPINRAHRDLQLGGNGLRRHRSAVAAEHLDQPQQSFGAAHVVFPAIFEMPTRSTAMLLTPCCQ